MTTEWLIQVNCVIIQALTDKIKTQKMKNKNSPPGAMTNLHPWNMLSYNAWMNIIHVIEYMTILKMYPLVPDLNIHILKLASSSDNNKDNTIESKKICVWEKDCVHLQGLRLAFQTLAPYMNFKYYSNAQARLALKVQNRHNTKDLLWRSAGFLHFPWAEFTSYW